MLNDSFAVHQAPQKFIQKKSSAPLLQQTQALASIVCNCIQQHYWSNQETQTFGDFSSRMKVKRVTCCTYTVMTEPEIEMSAQSQLITTNSHNGMAYKTSVENPRGEPLKMH